MRARATRLRHTEKGSGPARAPRRAGQARAVSIALAIAILLVAADATASAAQLRPGTDRSRLTTHPADAFDFLVTSKSPLDIGSLQDPGRGTDTQTGGTVLFGALGSLVGLGAGAILGYRLDLARDAPSEDPGLAGLILGAAVGSTLGTSMAVAAVDGQDHTFAPALAGAAAGVMVGFVGAGRMEGVPGVVAFSLVQAICSALAVRLFD